MDIIDLFLPFTVGAALGLFYFGGLWWTISRLAHSGQAAWLFPISFAARLAVLLGGTYLVADGRWQRVLACLAGILVTRGVLIFFGQRGPGEREKKEEVACGPEAHQPR